MMRAIAMVLVLALVGCAEPYKRDLAGKASARVRMVSTFSGPARPALITKECVPPPLSDIQWAGAAEEMAVLPGRGREPKRESIGMPMTSLPEYASFTEQQIPAGVAVRLAFRGMNGNAACTIATQFTPQEGADYEVIYGEESGGRAGRCTIAVFQLRATTDGKAVRSPVSDLQRVPRCPGLLG
jgi:hypothetical protein